ncbi:MAG: hypothetical protein MK207_02105 [Saprospiraceae bacterium]|nr:hypothetical protein [Saprospiraceae bacterium]
MRKRLCIGTFLILFFALGFSSCEKGPITTYQDVKHIISTSCAVSGCHDPITVRQNIDFSTYATMSGSTGLNNALTKNTNSFYDRVLVKQNMPPNGSLSQADRDILQQWVDSNYPEN